MVGRPVAAPQREALPPGEVIMQLAGVSLLGERGEALLGDLHLLLYGREILGIAGVSGNGQGALAALLSGLRLPDEGSFELLGEAGNTPPPAALQRHGVGRNPQARHPPGVSPAPP